MSGPLFGGTITQLVASLGTPFAFDPPDGCVFLEEVNERPLPHRSHADPAGAGSGVLARRERLSSVKCEDATNLVGRSHRHRRDSASDTRLCGPILVDSHPGTPPASTWTLPLGVAVCLDSAQSSHSHRGRTR